MPRSAAKRVGPQEKPSEPVLEDAEAAPERPFVAAVGTAETEGGLEVDRNVFECESERDASIKWHASRSDRRVPLLAFYPPRPDEREEIKNRLPEITIREPSKLTRHS